MNFFKQLKEVSLRGKLLTDVFNRKPTVSVITLQGTIMAGGSGFNKTPPINLEGTRKMIDKAFSQRDLKAVLLSVNSPGGSAVQSDLVSSYIKAKAEKEKVEVIVFVEDVAASGGYWLACTGSRIYASRSSVVGSIGVISSGLGFHELIEKYGVERRVFTAGENKSVLDPLSPLKESDVKIIKTILNDIHQHFINHVKGSRGTKLRGEDKELFNGEFWTGLSAVELGLIDGIDNLDAFIEREYGDTVKVFRAKRLTGLAGLLSTYLEPKLSVLERFIQSPGLQAPSEIQAFNATDTAANQFARNNLK
ncbi:uncharacterized protein LOC111711273 isoform X2 [Eurytemora carolleeae]|uniref:uncharacterized protein LOC111711273 isoform X2 n=1 Tax=Eurytemora carolleeae TaxID=1294199 RepID=UPI000C755F45|nr:uncharacterized protein LOC111711273 isoform X2 [Eurytemora carolleeae]|eukprot:XP_023341347.1 uncharacterized protein LOC111711273 isoform X2 [Eurytemora affinis]